MLFEAYRAGKRVYCERCRKPFPLEIVTLRRAFAQLDKGDNIVWEGKWLYDAKDGLLFPHNDLLENLRYKRPAGAGTRFRLPLGKESGLQYPVKVKRVPGCPRTAICPNCRARNGFNAAKLLVSPKEPSTAAIDN